MGAVEAAGLPRRAPRRSRAAAPRAGRSAQRSALIICALLIAAGAAGLDDPGAAVRQLAVARADAGHAGRPLGRLAVPPGRVGRTSRTATATMDTLISLGMLAAVAVVALRAGLRRRRHARHADELRPDPRAGAGSDEIYLETAAIVTTFILAGRYFEARAKRRAGAALTALLELGAKEVDAAATAARSHRGAHRSATTSSSARARRSPPTASSSRATRPST